jgi:transaldolase
MTQNPSLAAVSAAGVSVWLDDLSRDLLQSGKLQQLIDARSVVGVTTKPSTFERAYTRLRLPNVLCLLEHDAASKFAES